MFSVGLDMVEISRIRKSMQKERFLKFILGDEEYIELKNKNFPVQSVAANFCAKEAFLKSVGMGIREKNLRDIQILREKSGKPYFFLKNKILDIVNEKNLDFSLSLTHTKEYASAVVICFSKD